MAAPNASRVVITEFPKKLSGHIPVPKVKRRQSWFQAKPAADFGQEGFSRPEHGRAHQAIFIKIDRRHPIGSVPSLGVDRDDLARPAKDFLYLIFSHASFDLAKAEGIDLVPRPKNQHGKR